MLLARRWTAAAASSANDSPSSMVAATARSVSAATSSTSPSSSSSSSSSSLGTKHVSSRSFASLPLFEEDVGQPTHETHPEVRKQKERKKACVPKKGTAFFSLSFLHFFFKNPHLQLLAPGELAPGVTPYEIASRRDALAQRMEEAAAAASPSSSFFTRNSSSSHRFTRTSRLSRGLHLAILPSPLPVMMAGVIPYPYREEKDFTYLTGVVQPGCVAVVVAEEGGGGGDEGEESSLGRLGKTATATTASSKKKRRHRFILFVPDECPRARLWDGGRLSVEAAKRVFGADEAFPMSQVRQRRRRGFFFLRVLF